MFAGVCAGLWSCLLGSQRSRVRTPNLAHKFQRNKVFLLCSLEIIYFVRILRARPPCSASYQQGPHLESCVWKAVSSHSSHHLQEVLLTQFSLYVHKGGLKPHLFYFISREVQWADCQPTICWSLSTHTPPGDWQNHTDTGQPHTTQILSEFLRKIGQFLMWCQFSSFCHKISG